MSTGLCDASTCSELTSLAEFDPSGDSRVLSNGRILVTSRARHEAVQILAATGAPERFIDMPGRVFATGTEYEGGKLAVAVGRERVNQKRTWFFCLVDSRSGEVRQTSQQLVPAAIFQYGAARRAGLPVSPGAPSSRLFLSPELELVRFNPSDGTREIVVGRSDRR